ncbi:MAG: hypothetical protein PVJ51_03665 [Acidobacteriota bacterium]|jgi:hypothetical protein
MPSRHLPRALALLALLAFLALPACVTPPRAVGPTTMAGPLPPPSEGQTALAERAPGATEGPLRIIAPRFMWTHASTTEATYAWDCTVENPGDEGFRVTVVVQLLDATGRRLAADNQSVSVSGNSRTAVRGEGLLEADLSAAVSSWRVEYWVEPRVTSN